MKKIIIGIFAATAIVGIFFFTQKNSVKKQPTYTIGIIQTASHPALDASRDGFIEELNHLLNGDVSFVVKNAQGSVAQAHALAQQMRSNRTYNGFFAIATPAAQALHAAEKERPVFIAAVTDPQALGFVYKDTNICGTKDMIDVPGQINLITQIVPQAKTIGLLYTSGEANSIVLVESMRKEIANRGLTALDFAVSNESDIPVMVQTACRKVDLLLAPTDNTIASAIGLISTLARKNKKPLIVSDNMLVQYGPLASRGVDYKANGAQTARIAHAVLVDHKKPAELPIEQASSDQIYINTATAAELDILIPDSIKNNVVFVD